MDMFAINDNQFSDVAEKMEREIIKKNSKTWWINMRVQRQRCCWKSLLWVLVAPTASRQLLRAHLPSRASADHIHHHTSTYPIMLSFPTLHVWASHLNLSRFSADWVEYTGWRFPDVFLSKDVCFMRNDNLFPRDFFFKKQIHGSMYPQLYSGSISCVLQVF